MPDKVPVKETSDVKPIKPDKTESELKKEKEDELYNNTEPEQNDDKGKQDTQNKMKMMWCHKSRIRNCKVIKKT